MGKMKEYNNFKLDRTMKSLFKDTPSYVFDDFFNADGGMWRSLVDELLNKGYDVDDIENEYSDYVNLNWELKRVEVNIDDFTDKTQETFRSREMGDKFISDIPDDEQRTLWQRDNVIEGNNEPLIMFKKDDKYELVEGYHRCMALLKRGDNGGDYSTWRKVKIIAYIAEF